MEEYLGRKAQTPGDAILMSVFLLALAIGGLFAFYMSKELFNSFGGTELNSTVTAPVYEKALAVNDMWDYIIFAVFIGFALGVIILGYFIDVQSIFMPIYIVGLLVGVCVSFIMSYIWTQLISSVPAELSTISTNSFPITNVLMTNLPLFFTCVGVLGMIATYAKVNPQ